MKLGAIAFAFLVADLPSLPARPQKLAEERVLRFVWATSHGPTEELDGVDESISSAIVLTLLARPGKRRRGCGGVTCDAARVHKLSWPEQRALTHHVRSLVLTSWIRENFTRREALTFWLDHAYFGHAVYGIDTAAAYVFGTTPAELTLPELALLMALERGSQRGADGLAKRQRFLLERARESGAFTDVELAGESLAALDLFREHPEWRVCVGERDLPKWRRMCLALPLSR